MTLSVTNTLTGERERFEPRNDDEVLLYVCGLTVSDEAHLGHARLWMHADVMHRWLDHEGYDVRHVENFTDVNEKITARVGERDGPARMHERVDVVLVEEALGSEGGLDFAGADYGSDHGVGLQVGSFLQLPEPVSGVLFNEGSSLIRCRKYNAEHRTPRILESMTVGAQ